MNHRHAVIMLMYNRTPEQLELSKRSLQSVLAQDIGLLNIYIYNNGSTQPTRDWLDEIEFTNEPHLIACFHGDKNESPIKIANSTADLIFESHDKVLGVANDAIIPPNLYRLMNEWPRGFVAASETRDESFATVERGRAVSENTPMAVMLTRKWAYDALMMKDGYFLDPRYFHYASDCDLALRMAQCGIRGIQLDIPYYHYGSAHWRMMGADEGKIETDKADRDRAAFERKWGFKCDSLEYSHVAEDLNFTRPRP